MTMGMYVKIEPLLEEWRMGLSERGIEIKKKPGQIVHTMCGLFGPMRNTF